MMATRLYQIYASSGLLYGVEFSHPKYDNYIKTYLAPAGRNHWSYLKIEQSPTIDNAVAMMKAEFAKNAPANTASTITVKDVIPDGLTILNTIPQGKVEGQTVTWDLTALPAGKHTVKVVTQVTGPNAFFNNTAEIAVGSLPAQNTNTTYHMISSAVNVIHRDKTTGDVLDQEIYPVSPGAYGPYNAQTFPEYNEGVLASDSDPASGTIAIGETKNVIWLYEKLPSIASILVMHMDRLGDVLLGFDHLSVTPGNYGPIEPKSFPGYSDGVLAPSSAPASGTIVGGAFITITYHYDKLATITYLPGSRVFQGTPGTGGSTETVAIGSLYTFKSGFDAGIIMPELPEGYNWTFRYWTTLFENTSTNFGNAYYAGDSIYVEGNMTVYSRYDIIG
jgi:hypothetical protein